LHVTDATRHLSFLFSQYERKPMYNWEAMAPPGLTSQEAEARWNAISRDVRVTLATQPGRQLQL
jgi:hypothetical protein